jgi:hypothetical protein
MELEEMEIILLLNGFELKPYLYEEHEEYDGLLSMSLRVLLSDRQFKDLMDKLQHGPFNIVRKGIDEKPRRVAYSFNGWSKNGDTIKCQITFIDFEEKRRLRDTDPLWNLIPLVSKQGQMIEQLSNLLIQKGILNEDEYQSIKAQTAYSNFEAFYVDDDLDKYEFKT